MKFSILFIGLASLLFALDVFAGTGGSQFDTYYSEIVGWLDGAPGKGLMALMFLVAGYFAVIEPNFMRAGAAALFGLVFANASAFITGFLTATI
ncbi:hypothetical protein [Pseudoalteromonas sp. T1lg23B]|uniref:hypothetical protein n=1 Tax=Pseudoalteromonas sp. T1lg23B TaxID=2077097 RepID=UPI000CF69482|nr:hypothetical protein [Pseudoalteromonas sp. T1lg23B]